MRCHAIIHKALPVHGAGAEAYIHSVMKWLVARGHDCSASVAHADGSWELDGVRYVGERRPSEDPIAAADLLFTHLDQTRIAAWHATRARKPLVHFVHNDAQLRHWRIRPHEAQLVVFNSRWIEATVKWDGPSTVVPPPVFADDYRVTPPDYPTHDAVVLVNLSEAKGAHVFWELARSEPKRRFIGVLGAYGEQVIPKDPPPNVEVWENRADPRDFYREARVILMPSSYESWGRVPVEAAASGIPTIAHPTAGLGESMGPAAIFCSRYCPTDWWWALHLLDDPEFYAERSAIALMRSQYLEPEPNLLALEEELRETLARGWSKPSGANPKSRR
jgi:glycosyltransferase involved in cell wall biosynthesis